MVHRHQGSGRRPSSSNVYGAAASSIHKDSPSNDQQQNLTPNSSFNSSSHALCSSTTRVTPDISHFCHFESDHIQSSFTSNNAGERLHQTSSIDYSLCIPFSSEIQNPAIAEEAPYSYNLQSQVPPETAHLSSSESSSEQVALRNITNWQVQRNEHGSFQVSEDGETLLPPGMLNRLMKQISVLSMR